MKRVYTLGKDVNDADAVIEGFQLTDHRFALRLRVGPQIDKIDTPRQIDFLEFTAMLDQVKVHQPRERILAVAHGIAKKGLGQ